MRVTVQLSSLLAKRLKIDEIIIDAVTYRDVLDACKNLLPGVTDIIKKRTAVSLVCKDKCISLQELDFKVSDDILRLVPTVSGGVAGSFDSLGNLNIFYGASKAYSTEEMSITGVNRRIIDSSLFGQSETAFDTAQRRSARQDGTLEGNEDPTTGFGSINLTSVYGQPIPLNFGLVRVGGAVINSYIKHIQRGSVDSVRVSDYVE